MNSVFLLAFWVFLLAALAIGWQAGDRRDRKIILAIVGAATLTDAAYFVANEPVALVLVSMVDFGLLALVVSYALRTERYWPIWFAGFHAASTAIGLIALLVPQAAHIIPERVGSFWSLPALLAMTIGLLLDKRQGIAQAPA